MTDWAFQIYLWNFQGASLCLSAVYFYIFISFAVQFLFSFSVFSFSFEVSSFYSLSDLVLVFLETIIRAVQTRYLVKQTIRAAA